MVGINMVIYVKIDMQNANFVKMKTQYGDSTKWMITGDYGLIQFLKI